MPEPRMSRPAAAERLAERVLDRLVENWAAKKLPGKPLADALFKAAVAALVVEHGAEQVAAMLHGFAEEIATLDVPLHVAPPAGRA